LKPEEYQIMYQAEDTLWWYRGMEVITRRVIQRFYTREEGLNILDAGCGTGAGMKYLSDYGFVTGLDYSPLALQFSRQRGETLLVRGSVTDLPFQNAAFDLVTSFDVLYTQGIDDEQALHEFRRVLATGGRIILRLPAYDWLRGAHDEAINTGHRYTVGEIRAKMTKSGFVVDHTSYANMWLFPLAMLKRLSDRLLSRQGRSDLTLGVGPLNGILQSILASEARFVAGKGLAFGLSVVAVGRKM